MVTVKATRSWVGKEGTVRPGDMVQVDQARAAQLQAEGRAVKPEAMEKSAPVQTRQRKRGRKKESGE